MRMLASASATAVATVRKAPVTARASILCILFIKAMPLHPQAFIQTFEAYSTTSAIVALNNCLAVEGETSRSRFNAITARRPLVVAFPMCCVYRSSESVITPRILAVFFGAITSLIVDGLVLVLSGRLVRWIITILSPSNLAPLRLSYYIAVDNGLNTLFVRFY